MKQLTGPLILALAFWVAVPAANASPISLELLLLADISGSMDTTEYNLQKMSYVNYFRSTGFHNLIATIPGGIRVAYAEFSGAAEQRLWVPWMLVTDAASANAFADAIEPIIRPYAGMTAPGSALNWAIPLFTTAQRKVIDISGDGRENDGADTLTAATAAHAAGITINGLPILTDDWDLDDWYWDNIVQPGGGFMRVAWNYWDFEKALYKKITAEVTGDGMIPEPSTFVVVLGALPALLLARRLRG